MGEKSSWGLAEGAEIAPRRSVLRAIGGGHRYEVYLVWDERLFSIMVAKVLRPDLAESESALRGLKHEADALDRLAHPVLLRGFGAVLEGPYPHVLVEHLEGPTLRRLIRRGGPLAPEQALPMALHVSAALHYLHGEGMVHLDVKPDNIVMGIPPRLIDLSLARTIESASRITHHIGTNAYMPPEQCAPGQAGVIGPASDVWGIGATLFHAVSGRRPFPKPASTGHDALLEERFPQLAMEPREPGRKVAGALAEALMPTLRDDPKERPTAAGFASSLQPLVAALPAKLVQGGRGEKVA